jgi:large subunit ribosomal protein L4
MNVQIYTTAGTASESIALNPDIFEAQPNAHVVYQAVRLHLANRRQGTAKSKERSDVSGGGKKPWRQKGRGTARSGSSRSPLWVGGGTIFGPRPRTYHMTLPTKVRQLARRSAWAMKAQDGQIRVVEDFTVSEPPKTSQMYGILKALALHDTKTLLLVPAYDRNLWLAARNIPTLAVSEAANASTYDILNTQVVLIQKSALPVIEGTFTKI